MTMRSRAFALMLIAGVAAVPSIALAQAKASPAAEAQALELTKTLIGYRSVEGNGNQTPQLAARLKSVLVQGGFAADDIEVTSVDDTAYLLARWRGSDAKAKPLVISGHMDVVEAKPKDWERDPFTAVVENGYIYGRGATDMKTDMALAVATLIDMKKAGYKPRRDIILAFSGDEETAMKTTGILADKLPGAEMVLNIDGGGGFLSEDNMPQYFTVGGAEKTYADFRLTVTNPGGHSSAPRKDNAINQLSAALVKIGQYQFTPQLNEITKAYFEGAASRQPPEIAAAMRAFAKDPADKAAIATLTASPAFVGQIGTTCVSTKIEGGHALNALPQSAVANINCRIFPGVKPADVMAKLKEVATDPAVKFEDVSEGTIANDASPLRPDMMAAVKKALAGSWPNVPILPAMSAGASDSMWFRAKGVPSYGISPLFGKESDDFSHGLNERVQTMNIAPAIRYYRVLFTDLSK